ncbi:hypothetical protein IB260_10680 [Pseudomonas sp. PDM23]|uniref:hypothetical protein n=1 Tax=unclassified Pseudomonas TaxID=196821 RepID=UPI001783E931|nr:MULTISPECIES: hypothetical protein [unclassified Pseudomonas]MBD9499494.1 hypothetical protein [Pseudomonas sp. PDM17]MBD9575773.1 hypothetical protein [Pseudomonas sp. PDM23]MBD9669282.1 hypothetical protein [Pseudomonas sp. PDM21]
MFRFIKTTIAGGLLFILPLVLLFILIEKAIHLLSGPLQKVLPIFEGFSVAGATSVTVAAIFVLLLFCFLAGLLARTAAASSALRALEDRLLGNLPGYQLLKDATARFTGMENIEGARVVMVIQESGYRFGLCLESREDWLLVYMPDGGPAGGTAGEVQTLTADAVVMTDIPWLSLLACLRRGGRGALELAAPYLDGKAFPARD